jgi:hypothetical protein
MRFGEAGKASLRKEECLKEEFIQGYFKSKKYFWEEGG